MLLTLDLLPVTSRLSSPVTAGWLYRCLHLLRSFFFCLFTTALCFFMAPLCALLFLNKCLWQLQLFLSLIPASSRILQRQQQTCHRRVRISELFVDSVWVIADTPKLTLFLSLDMLGIIVISSTYVQIFQNIISHEVHLLAGMMLSAALCGNSVRDIKQESREQSAYSDSELYLSPRSKYMYVCCILGITRNLDLTSGCFCSKVLI